MRRLLSWAGLETAFSGAVAITLTVALALTLTLQAGEVGEASRAAGLPSPGALSPAGAPEDRSVVLTVHTRADWVEGRCDPGSPVLVEVREPDDVTVKGVAEATSGYPPWLWGDSGFSTRIGDPWVPARPDIQPGDWVHVWIDPPSTPVEIRVGDIQGVVDVTNDTVSGTVTAPWLAGPVDGSCRIAVAAAAPDVPFQVDPNGGSYLCDFANAGWDLTASDQVQVAYRQSDQHEVVNQFQDPGASLGAVPRGLGAPTTGANFEYAISYWNIGEAAAADTTLEDYLPDDVSFLASTLGIDPVVGGQTLQYDLGTVDPGTLVEFSLFVAVSAPVGTIIENVVLIFAPEETGMGTSVYSTVQSNDTDLTVLSTASSPQPLPGSDLVWDIEVCNVGATSSAEAWVSDLVPPVTTPVAWWGDQAGWVELVVGPDEVAVARPTVSGGQCLGLHVMTFVPGSVTPGAQLCNLVVVDSANDLDPSNNVHEACVTVGGGAPAIAIEKATNGFDADDPPGPVVPVGEPVQWTYQVTNTGNMTLGGLVVVDDQPGVVPVCPDDELAPGEVIVCSAVGEAVEGQYANIGTATAAPQPGGDPVAASDPSHYLGVLSDLIFEDGFESGDTAAWSATVP